MDGLTAKRMLFEAVVVLAIITSLLMPCSTACNVTSNYIDGAMGEPSPHLVVSGITGSRGVSAEIKNDGDANATNVVCSLTVAGGIMGGINVTKSDTLTGILVGGTHIVTTGLLIGLGSLSVNVTATCDQGVSASGSYKAMVLFFYVLV
jgi:hypothetical protein